MIAITDNLTPGQLKDRLEQEKALNRFKLHGRTIKHELAADRGQRIRKTTSRRMQKVVLETA